MKRLLCILFLAGATAFGQAAPTPKLNLTSSTHTAEVAVWAGLDPADVSIDHAKVIADQVRPETLPPGTTFEPVYRSCLLYTSPSPRDATLSRMPSSA